MRASGAISEAYLKDLEAKLGTWGNRLEGLSVEMRELGQRRVEEVRQLFQNETRSLIDSRWDFVSPPLQIEVQS